MAHPPQTKKAIPLTLRAWKAEVTGIKRLLRNRPIADPCGDPEWLEHMYDYYQERLDDLLDNAPGVAVKRGDARQQREDWNK